MSNSIAQLCGEYTNLRLQNGLYVVDTCHRRWTKPNADTSAWIVLENNTRSRTFLTLG